MSWILLCPGTFFFIIKYLISKVCVRVAGPWYLDHICTLVLTPQGRREGVRVLRSQPVTFQQVLLLGAQWGPGLGDMLPWVFPPWPSPGHQ